MRPNKHTVHAMKMWRVTIKPRVVYDSHSHKSGMIDTDFTYSERAGAAGVALRRAMLRFKKEPEMFYKSIRQLFIVLEFVDYDKFPESTEAGTPCGTTEFET